MAKSVDSIMKVFTKAVKELTNRTLELESDIDSDEKSIMKLNDKVSDNRSEIDKAVKIKSKLQDLCEGC